MQTKKLLSCKTSRYSVLVDQDYDLVDQDFHLVDQELDLVDQVPWFQNEAFYLLASL